MNKSVTILLFICLMWGWSVEAYDPPPEIMLHRLYFDWSRHGGTPPCPAIDIQWDPSDDVGTPEWTGMGHNEPAAYIKNTSVKVRPGFYASGIDSCWVRATSSDFLGNLGGQTGEKVDFWVGIPFFSDGPYYFQAANNTVNYVAKKTVTWQWKVRNINGSGSSEVNFDTSGPHTIYVLLGSPQAPMAEPWADVLDYSCDWASGKTTPSSAVTAVTNRLHTCGVTYDPWDHYTTGSYTDLDLSSLLIDLIINPDDVEMDCRDFSNFLHVLTNSLGVSGQYNRIGWWFYYNWILSANWPYWHTGGWIYHQVGWFDSKVADASAKIDNDSDPTQGPGDQNHDPRLPVGDMELSDYIDKLTEWNVYSVATGTCTVH